MLLEGRYSNDSSHSCLIFPSILFVSFQPPLPDPHMHQKQVCVRGAGRPWLTQTGINKLVNNAIQIIVLLNVPEGAVSTSAPPSFLTSVSLVSWSTRYGTMLGIGTMVGTWHASHAVPTVLALWCSTTVKRNCNIRWKWVSHYKWNSRMILGCEFWKLETTACDEVTTIILVVKTGRNRQL